jgi:DNA polymerase-4
MRIIAHVDMDAFFAAIEQRDDPRLAGRPVIIGGRKDTPRGVVSTCSYEARRYGVRSAMPLAEAARLCPHGVFMPGNMAKYVSASRKLNRILAGFTPLIEQVSIDEAYLDLSEIAGDSDQLRAIGERIKTAIRKQLSLTASVGMGESKFVAKLASDLQKPDGLTIVMPEDFDRIILPLPLERLHGVGAKTAARLKSLGLRTVEDVRNLPVPALEAACGKYGRTLHDLCRGIDPRPVETSYEAKSVGREVTFPKDVANPEALKKVLAQLAQSVANRLAKESAWGRTVTLKVRFPDFTTWTRSKTLEQPFGDRETILQLAEHLLEGVRRESGRANPAFRLVGVSVSHLAPFRQIDRFVTGRGRTVDKLLSDVKSRFGPGSIRLGSDGKD